MVRNLLIRGMFAGVGAAVLAFVFAYFLGEPALDGAIGYEEGAAAVAGGEMEHHHHELVSRGVQSTLGLGVGLLVYGLGVGGIFALVYAAVSGRVGRLGPRATAAVLAGVAYVVVVVVPMLKYPSNPPGATDAGTVSSRTALYLLMILFSVVAAIGAVAAVRRLTVRLGVWNGVLLALAGYVVVMAVVGTLMPVVDETPVDFPAGVLYDFRLATLGMQLVLWGAIGLLFGALVDPRSRRGERSAVSVGGQGRDRERAGF